MILMINTDDKYDNIDFIDIVEYIGWVIGWVKGGLMVG